MFASGTNPERRYYFSSGVSCVPYIDVAVTFRSKIPQSPIETSSQCERFLHSVGFNCIHVDQALWSIVFSIFLQTRNSRRVCVVANKHKLYGVSTRKSI